MAVTLRLRRMGRKKRPVYALVAADARSPRDGRYIEDLGRYDAVSEPATVTLKRDRVLYWLSQGAITTDTARSLMSREGVLLEFALSNAGKNADEIAKALEAHRAGRSGKTETRLTPAARKAEALQAERKRVSEEQAQKARQRAEAEAEARRKAEQEAAAAAEAAARAEAEAAAEAPAEAATETPAEEAPASEATDETESAPVE